MAVNNISTQGDKNIDSHSDFELVVHPELCSGCRACELVCSFHHRRTFSRGKSSVYVKRNERKGVFEIMVEGRSPACDLCEGEKHPLCVQFCFMKALTLRRVGS